MSSGMKSIAPEVCDVSVKSAQVFPPLADGTSDRGIASWGCVPKVSGLGDMIRDWTRLPTFVELAIGYLLFMTLAGL
jgi:hypothetical protein